MAIDLAFKPNDKLPEWQPAGRFSCPSLLEDETGNLWLRCFAGGVVRLSVGVYLPQPQGDFRLYNGSVEIRNRGV